MRWAFMFVAAIFLPLGAGGQNQRVSRSVESASPPSAASSQVERDTIQQLEDEWLKGERMTDPATLEKILADDFVNLTPAGIGPGKADLLRNFREHAGTAPPYSVRGQGMHIYILGEAAVAAYVKIYTASENGNVAREDDTHVFTKDHGVWKLRVSRTSPHQAEQSANP